MVAVEVSHGMAFLISKLFLGDSLEMASHLAVILGERLDDHCCCSKLGELYTQEKVLK